MAFGLGSLALSVVTIWVSKTQNLIIILFAMSIVCLLTNLFVKESVKWLYRAGRVSQFYELLCKLSAENESLLTPGSIKQTLGLVSYNFKKTFYKVSLKKGTRISTRKFLKVFVQRLGLSSLAFILLGVLLTLFRIKIEESIAPLKLQSLHLNQIIIRSTQLIGFILSVPIIVNLPRKLTVQISLIWIILVGFLLKFFSKRGPSQFWLIFRAGVYSLGLNLPLAFLLTVLTIYIIETYPTKVRIFVYGHFVLFWSLACLLVRPLATLAQKFNYEYTFLLCLLALVILPLSFFMKETSKGYKKMRYGEFVDGISWEMENYTEDTFL